MDSLVRSRKLYEAMDFSSFVITEKPGTYSMDNGNMQMEVVHKTAFVEVLHGMCKPGTKIAAHTHDQTENVLLYEGRANMDIAGVVTTLRPAMTINVPPRTLHFISSERGCKFMVTRIPPVEGVY